MKKKRKRTIDGIDRIEKNDEDDEEKKTLRCSSLSFLFFHDNPFLKLTRRVLRSLLSTRGETEQRQPLRSPRRRGLRRTSIRRSARGSPSPSGPGRRARRLPERPGRPWGVAFVLVFLSRALGSGKKRDGEEKKERESRNGKDEKKKRNECLFSFFPFSFCSRRKKKKKEKFFPFFKKQIASQER